MCVRQEGGGDGNQTRLFSRMKPFFFFVFQTRKGESGEMTPSLETIITTRWIITTSLETDTIRPGTYQQHIHTCLVLLMLVPSHHFLFFVFFKRISFRLKYFYDIFPLLSSFSFLRFGYSITTSSSESERKRKKIENGFTRFTPGRLPLARAQPHTFLCI
jgi:hypothetical protein